MAAVKKYSRDAAHLILEHNSRQHHSYKNKDIDPERTKYNITIFDKGHDGYKKRLKELNVFNRGDVKTLCEWVVTIPTHAVLNDWPDENNSGKSNCESVLEKVSNFLCERYGDENCIQAIIHADEKGKPHLHFTFIPTVVDKKHGGEKVCAKQVLTKTELLSFHPELRDYLNQKQREGKIPLKPKPSGSKSTNDTGGSTHAHPSKGITKEDILARSHISLMRDGYSAIRQPIRAVGEQNLTEIRIGDLFYTGVTKAQGGNKTVEQLKQESAQQRTATHSADVSVTF